MCCGGTSLLLCLCYKWLDQVFHYPCISKAVVYYRSSFSEPVIAFFLRDDALFILAGHGVDVSSEDNNKFQIIGDSGYSICQECDGSPLFVVLLPGYSDDT